VAFQGWDENLPERSGGVGLNAPAAHGGTEKNLEAHPAWWRNAAQSLPIRQRVAQMKQRVLNQELASQQSRPRQVFSDKLTRRPGSMTRERKRRSSVVEIGNGPARIKIVLATSSSVTIEGDLG